MTFEVTVALSGTLLEMEGAIQEASNAVGCCATEEALTRFDTDGSPIRVGETKLHAITHISAGSESPGAGHTERHLLKSRPITTDGARTDGRGDPEQAERTAV